MNAINDRVTEALRSREWKGRMDGCWAGMFFVWGGRLVGEALRGHEAPVWAAMGTAMIALALWLRVRPVR